MLAWLTWNILSCMFSCKSGDTGQSKDEQGGLVMSCNAWCPTVVTHGYRAQVTLDHKKWRDAFQQDTRSNPSWWDLTSSFVLNPELLCLSFTVVNAVKCDILPWPRVTSQLHWLYALSTKFLGPVILSIWCWMIFHKSYTTPSFLAVSPCF